MAKKASRLTYEELVEEAKKLQREVAKDRECLDEMAPCKPRMNVDPDLLCAACAARLFARTLVSRLEDWRDAKRKPVNPQNP